MDLIETWEVALGEIELSISKAQFNTWFKGTSILSIENSRVTIRVANGFAKEWLENKYNLIIIRALNNMGHSLHEIRCEIGTTPLTSTKPLRVDAITAPKNSSSFHSLNKAPFSSQKISLSSFESNINSKYTFDNFIVGSNNELARAACFAVSEDLGSLYNPLFLYGGVGLGKTHLLQSIGNAILQKDQTRRVLYTTSEKFTQELITSIKQRSIEQFKDHYKSIDLLIIDDIQFLSGKEKTQNEFFHIFNTLYQQNKQIVLSSDRPPKAIATLEDRLRSRFEGGMIADINPPDLETRIAILQNKAQQRNLSLDDQCLEYIARNITNNIRELEGALNRIVAIQQFNRLSSLSLSVVQDILKELISEVQKRAISHQEIVQAVCEFYTISSEDLRQKGRKKEVATARQIAMYLMRKELQMPYTGIGRYFNGRDHTTALHAYEKIKKLLDVDERIKKDVLFLQDKIYYTS